MAKTKFIDNGTNSVYLETDADGVTATPAGPLFSKALQKISDEVAKAIAGADEKSRPSGVTVSFQLKLVAGGQFMITNGTTSGNFSVEMRFGDSATRPAIPGLPTSS